MATLINTYYGPETGPVANANYRFRVVAQFQYTDTDENKGWNLQGRFYLEVTKSPSSSVWAYAKSNWQDARIGLSSVGVYADSGWVDWGWRGYGETVQYECYANYTGGSGTTYESKTAGSFVIPIPTYTVSYNANGGSGAPSSQTKTHNVNLILSGTKPTRPGYTFSGWSDSASGSKLWDAGGTYTWNQSCVLYALWTPVTYSITYDANGGSGAPASQKKTHGVNLTLSNTRPTKSGGINVYNIKLDANGGECSETSLSAKKITVYSFSNWKGSDGKSYAPGATYSTNAALTLTAVWTATISKTSVVLPEPTRLGYKFLFWGTSINATSGYAAGEEFYNEGNVTLYAIWEVDNAIYINILEEWFFGNVYAKLDGRWSLAMNVYFKDDGRWHMSTK